MQVLYLESLRLRTRDLPSLKFFKDTLEDKIGMETEDGAGAFSLVKHTLLAVLGILYFAWFADGAPWHAAIFWQAVAAVVIHHDHGLFRAAPIALPPHQRPLAAAVRPAAALLALIARPFVAMLPSSSR